jgi:transposase
MIPVWSLPVDFVYAMRRVSCPECGVRVEAVPWGAGKSPLTSAFAHHLASWARLLSWKEVGQRCGASWDTVARAVSWLVAWGLEHRSLDAIKAIGVVCSDMWKPYLKVIAKRVPDALNILDRFHIASYLTKAVDDTRRDEVRGLNASGKPAHLHKSRWVWLKRRSNLTGKQRTHLRELMAINLRTVKAYLLKEQFEHLWTYTSATWAGKFIDTWCRDVMRHRSLPRLKKVAKTIQTHRALILNYFKAKTLTKNTFSSGVVEGFNNKAKLCIRKSYGFRSDKYREMALYHALGNLPEPILTHRPAT